MPHVVGSPTRPKAIIHTWFCDCASCLRGNSQPLRELTDRDVFDLEHLRLAGQVDYYDRTDETLLGGGTELQVRTAEVIQKAKEALDDE